MRSAKRFGLSCALASPLDERFEIDDRRLTAHARQTLEAGCSSVTVFGTTGEGASVSLAERARTLEALLAGGIDLREEVVGGVASASVGDAVAQARMLVDRGCHSILLAPPFYFKDVTDEGLYRWFSQVFETIGPQGAAIILYHIPSVTHVALSIGLIGRLKAAFPDVLYGVKDSGSDWAYTEGLLRSHVDLAILIGNECHLAAGVRAGAAGAISGLANLCPKLFLRIIETGEDDPRVNNLVAAIFKFQIPAAVKAVLANRLNDPVWLNVRPPLVPLSRGEAASLVDEYRDIVS